MKWVGFLFAVCFGAGFCVTRTGLSDEATSLTPSLI